VRKGDTMRKAPGSGITDGLAPINCNALDMVYDDEFDVHEHFHA